MHRLTPTKPCVHRILYTQKIRFYVAQQIFNFLNIIWLTRIRGLVAFDDYISCRNVAPDPSFILGHFYNQAEN